MALTFELCVKESYCVEDPRAELLGKVFKFPYIEQIFDAGKKQAGSSMI